MTDLAPFAIAGYLWGGIPTADLLARRAGLDLRRSGSGNPGTNNALRVGGPRLASAVLVTEIAKGFVAAWVGRRLGGDLAGVAAGLGAVAGNVFNPYFRGRGGKGLGIVAGVTLATWPLVLPGLLVALAIGLLIARASGPATLLTLGTYLALAAVWPTSVRWWLVAGIVLLLAPKAIRDTVHPVKPDVRPSFRESR